MSATKEQLRAFFELVDEDKRQMAYDTIDEYVYFAERIAELKKLPAIEVSKANTAHQRVTAAGKLIKDYSNVIDAERKTLLTILYKVENSAADELLSKLSEFE